MTSIRFYLDEDATSRRLVEALRSRGADVVSAIEADMLAQSDEMQLEWACKHHRVLFSYNVRDFYRIHSFWLAQGKSHAGIVLGKQSDSVGDCMRGLLRLAATKSLGDMSDRVEFLSIWIQQQS